MKCPNCGKTVRSKHHCAFCGHQFDNEQTDKAVQEQTSAPYETVSNDDIPEIKPRRRGGFLRVIFNILQMVVALVVLFLAFLYGPRYVSQVLNHFNIQLFSTEQPKESSSVASTVPQPQSATSTTPTASTTPATSSAALTVKDKQVNSERYPMVELKMGFEQSLDQVDRNTFKFSVNNQPLTEYSLVKEGNTIVLRFVDPTYGAASKTGTQQTLALKAEAFKFDEQVSFQVPTIGGSAAQAQAVQPLLSQVDDKTLVAVQEVGTHTPFVSKGEVVEAGAMLDWFVLTRVYQQIEEKKFELTTPVTIKDSLKVAKDTGETAAKAEGETVTVEALIEGVILRQDATALNLLVEQVGGANELNTWLNTSGYFTTKINQPFTLSETGDLMGATTSVYDVTSLLNELAQDKLVSATVSEQLKQTALKTPLSAKFPTDLTDVKRRYEIITPDTASNFSHYSAILETEGKQYVVVVLSQAATSAEGANEAVATAVKSLYTAVSTNSATQESSSASSESSTEPAPEQPIGQVNGDMTNPNVQPAPVMDYFDDDKDGVLDPTPRPGVWYFDQAKGMWFYY